MGMLYEYDEADRSVIMHMHPDGSIADRPSSAELFESPLLNEFVERESEHLMPGVAFGHLGDEFVIGESLWNVKTGEPAAVKGVDRAKDGETIYVMEYTAAISRGVTGRYHASEMGDTWSRVAQGSGRRANRA